MLKNVNKFEIWNLCILFLWKFGISLISYPAEKKHTINQLTSPRLRNLGVASTTQPLCPAPSGVFWTVHRYVVSIHLWNHRKAEVSLLWTTDLYSTTDSKRQPRPSAKRGLRSPQKLLLEQEPDFVPEGDCLWRPQAGVCDVLAVVHQVVQLC